MKKSYSFLLVALFVHILSLTASHSIRLKFQPDFPIDSIRVHNLDNNSTYTFMGGDDLLFFFGVPTSLENIIIENDQLNVFSSPYRNEVQIGFSQKIAGITTCEVYNLQGKLMDKFSGLLESSYHRFTFVPDSRGVFLVRVSSPSSIRTSKFVSYGASSGAKLKYDGLTETKAVSNEQPILKMPWDQSSKLIVRQNDLLRVSCFSGTKAQTIYDYASGDKNYTLRFTDRYNHFRLYNIVASKPSFVDVMFAVTDASFLGVDDLNNLDFVVKENGSNISASESFRHVLRMNQVPFKIILLIDNSVSIVNDLEKVKQSAKQFVNKIRPNQQIAVYVFSDQPYLLQDFTVDTSKLQQAIDKISLGFPSTNLYGSMITALSRWTDEFSQTNFQQGAVILFTDGDDTQGSSTLNQVITARGQKKVYVIGLGSELTPSILNQISYPKPYVPIKSINDLESSFAEIQADIVRYSNSFYWLNYMSPKRTGKHTLSISTSGNKNPYNTSSITGEYSATGFQSVNSGVYVNIADTKLYGIDSVFCFYDGASYNFTNSRYGTVISEDSLVLKPTTYWAFKQPEYSWSVDNLTNFKLNNASYSTKVIKGVGGDTIITNLNVQDQANSYAKQLSLQMHPENPLFNIVSPDDVTERTVTLKGAVLNEGRLPVLSKGFVWNTSPNPTVLFSPKTNSGNGKGSIQAKVNDLKTGTQYYVKVYASNSQKTFYSEEQTFTTSMSLAELTTSAVTNITKNSALSGGIITHDGGSAVTARGVCWSTTTDPTINDSITKDGTGIGYFTSVLSGLNGGTTYYVKAYATSSIGTAYGTSRTFTTIKSAPVLTTTPVESITTTTAITGGNITHDGGASVTERGVCWSTTQSPTINNSKQTAGTGKGSFTNTITGLKTGTLYYIRSYARNSVGTAYGEELSFTTSIGLPELTTKEVTDITKNSALLGGTITHDGGRSITARGVCYSRLPNPTVNDSITTEGVGSGNFTSLITGLKAGTVYYVRAYASNSLGTSYGAIVTFKTIHSTPELTSKKVQNITSSTAESGGIITHDGGATVTVRGVCWSTSPTPTVNNSKTTDGSGEGEFTSSITGLKTGTTYYLRAYATNSIGTAYGDEFSFTTSIGLPELITTEALNITKNSALLGGSINHNGGTAITAWGVCYSRLPNPTVNDSITSEGIDSGNFTCTINGLKTGTLYYVRAYATNSLGTSYGAMISFTTLQSIPELTTKAVENITSTTSKSGGVITHDGGSTITARGVCWSTSPTPTINNSKTTNGSGVGEFTSSITGLKTGTTFYMRAYATNSIGTAYGDEQTFTTSIGLPELTTTAISNITFTTASSGGTITYDGGASITARGICWSTSPTPTLNDNKTLDGIGIGNFNSSLIELQLGTKYYVRAYATNSVGSAYGNELVFSTIGVVENPVTGKVWMDQNLGASRVANSKADLHAYGDFYQWGRATDGHEKRTSLTTSTLSNSDTPGHSQFIKASSGNRDWRSPQNNNLWQGVNGINNPCPVGFRIPTAAEWQDESASWSSSGSDGAFASLLKLPAASNRDPYYGTINNDAGVNGYYWSSTLYWSYANGLSIYTNFASVNNYDRAYGLSVRCIKD